MDTPRDFAREASAADTCPEKVVLAVLKRAVGMNLLAITVRQLEL